MKYWAQKNSTQEEATRILTDSAICHYGLGPIVLDDDDYPRDLDFATALPDEMINEEDTKDLAPKKRTRCKSRGVLALADSRERNRRLIGRTPIHRDGGCRRRGAEALPITSRKELVISARSSPLNSLFRSTRNRRITLPCQISPILGCYRH